MCVGKFTGGVLTILPRELLLAIHPLKMSGRTLSGVIEHLVHEKNHSVHCSLQTDLSWG